MLEVLGRATSGNVQKVLFLLDVLGVLMMLVMSVGRLASGVHWLTDVLGGVLLGAALTAAYAGVVARLDAAKAAKADGAFDISTIPVSTAALGAFPYIALPEGYSNERYGETKKEFARFPFWVNDKVHWVEGQFYGTIFSAVPGKDYSQFEVEKNFEALMKQMGAVQVGKPVHFEEMEPMDVIVVGCVAVTAQGGRTGKGGGFADLELGIFRELGKVPAHAQIVTTVHEVQVVDNDRIEMLAHDSALDWIATPERIIQTHSPFPQPSGVAWDVVQDDQIRDIPFLLDLKHRLVASKAH